MLNQNAIPVYIALPKYYDNNILLRCMYNKKKNKKKHLTRVFPKSSANV